MKLHLMVSFRTHLKLYDEEVIYNPELYDTFWSQAKNSFKNDHFGFQKIIWSHAPKQVRNTQSRFRNIDHNSLLRPLELIKLVVNEGDNEITQVFRDVKKQIFEDRELTDIDLVPGSMVVRLFNNSIGILELDVKLNEFFNDDKIESSLDCLQEFGVTLGENLAQLVYKKNIEDFLNKLITLSDSSQFIMLGRFNYEVAKANKILVPESTPEKYDIVVNWVTRTLLYEEEDSGRPSKIIEHWLKDSGVPELTTSVVENPDKCAYRWLNYLFRETSYKPKIIEANGIKKIDYTIPFCDVWEAMLISQYYYCAFETLNDSLDITLSAAFLNNRKKKIKNRQNLKKINRKLEREIIDAHEILIEYQNNFAYYKRNVASYVKDIMNGWDFDNSILNQVKNKIELCEQRMKALHQKTSERSALYTDLLLLSIAVISVIAFMFQVIEYGRNISHNADLAVYESNSFNLVKVLSERPTDFAITIGLGLMVVIFIIYYVFRRSKVLD